MARPRTLSAHLELLRADQVDLVEQDDVTKSDLVHRLVDLTARRILQLLRSVEGAREGGAPSGEAHVHNRERESSSCAALRCMQECPNACGGAPLAEDI